MKITQASYRRLWNLGNYENISVELTADVAEGESTRAALNALAAEANLWFVKRGRPVEAGGKA